MKSSVIEKVILTVEVLLVTLVLTAMLGLVAFVYLETTKAQGVERKQQSRGMYHLVDQPKIQQLLEKKKPEGKATGTMLKIAIIDTGYDTSLLDEEATELNLCDTGHYDFNLDKAKLGSAGSHGTMVGSIIAENLQDVNYCAVIYQVQTVIGITAESVTRAIKMATKEGIFAINISLEGIMHAQRERMALYDLGQKGTAIFVAAGNRHANLDEVCNSYPSCYHVPNLYVVGAADESMEFRAAYSNYGSRVSSWYSGDFIMNGTKMQGTSFASPRALADYVYASSLRFAGH